MTNTGGRAATTGVIPGRHGLSVGDPQTQTPLGWRWTLLTNVSRLETGHTPSRRKPEYWGGDVPWIGIKDARANHGRDIRQTIQSTNPTGIENSSARILPEGTVCLSRTASIGYITRMGCPMATSQDFVNWVCGDQLDSRFLLYLLLSETESLHRFAHGTTHQTIYFPEVKAFHVKLPPLTEQRRITAVLGALDDKIELNRKMSQTLEEMAQAVFKSWFIDFDGVSESDMVESELGLIPEGWEVREIQSVAKIVGGSTPSTKIREYWDGGTIHWTTPKDLSSLSTPALLDTDRKITPAGLAKISSGLLPAGTLIMSSRAPVGYLAIAEVALAVNQGYIAMPPGGALSSLFLLYWAEANMHRIKARAGGTTFEEISKRNFRPIPLVVPGKEEAQRFDDTVGPLYQRVANNERESRTLADLRDTLLPKLICGDIRVPEAEDLVEAAV
jgi:type I restriction enzyme, S subunit